MSGGNITIKLNYSVIVSYKVKVGSKAEKSFPEANETIEVWPKLRK